MRPEAIRTRRGLRWLATCLAGLLAGCGGATVVAVGVEGAGGGRTEGLPLVGRYDGSLSGWGTTAWLTIRMSRDGTAYATIRPVPGNDINLAGRFDSDRVLRLDSSSVSLDGEFSGATHPQDPRVYDPRGVRFDGLWQAAGGLTGRAGAYFEDWPPPLTTYYDSPSETSILQITWPIFIGSSSGGSSGGSSSGSSTGGTSGGGSGGTDTGGFTPPPTPEPDPPDAGGGDPLDDDIVFRQQRRLSFP